MLFGKPTPKSWGCNRHANGQGVDFLELEPVLSQTRCAAMWQNATLCPAVRACGLVVRDRVERI